MREEKHITKREEVPTVQRRTKSVDKKVIQPVIKDVIRPIHLRVQPVLQNGLKPTIFKGKEVHKAIDQGTQNLPTTYEKTQYEQEIRKGTEVRQSIFRSNSLPVIYKAKQFRPEINATVGESVRTDVYKQISGGTTVRPSIVRNSVLPTINQGTTVLKTVYGGTTTSNAGQVNIGYNQNINVNQQYVTGVVPNPTITQYRGVGLQQTGSIMGIGGGVGDLAADVTYSTKPGGQVLTGLTGLGVNKTTVTTTRTNPTLVGTVGTTGSVMGVGGGVGDLAADVTYSTKPGAQVLTGLTGLGVNKTTVTTTNVNPTLVGAVGTTGSVMGIGGGVGDYASDVTYSTKPGAQVLTGLTGVGVNKTITTTNVSPTLVGTVGTTGSVMGVGGGVGDYAADVTYSTNPNFAAIPGGVTPIANNNITTYL